jgi:hypothetical protein
MELNILNYINWILNSHSPKSGIIDEFSYTFKFIIKFSSS